MAMDIDGQKEGFPRNNDTNHADALVLLAHCKPTHAIKQVPQSLSKLCNELEDAGMRYRTEWLDCGDYQWVWRSLNNEITLPVLVKRYKSNDLKKDFNIDTDENFMEWQQQFTSVGISIQLHYVIQGDVQGLNLNSFFTQNGDGKTDIKIHQTDSLKQTVHLLAVMSAELGHRIFCGDFNSLSQASSTKLKKMIVDLPEQNCADNPPGSEQNGIHPTNFYTTATQPTSTRSTGYRSHGRKTIIHQTRMQLEKYGSDDDIILLEYENPKNVQKKCQTVKEGNKNERNIFKKLAVPHVLNKKLSAAKKHTSGKVYLMKNVKKLKCPQKYKSKSNFTKSQIIEPKEEKSVYTTIVAPKSIKSELLKTSSTQHCGQLSRGDNSWWTEDELPPDLSQTVQLVESEMSHDDLPPDLIKMEKPDIADPQLSLDLNWDLGFSSELPLSDYWPMEDKVSYCNADTDIYSNESPVENTQADHNSRSHTTTNINDNDNDIIMCDPQMYPDIDILISRASVYPGDSDSTISNTESWISDTTLNHNVTNIPENNTPILTDTQYLSPMWKEKLDIVLSLLPHSNSDTVKKDNL